MTRDNNKKTHYVVLGGKGGGQAESVEWNDILNKPEFATVATSGDYDDLNDKPTILTQWFGTQAEYDAIVTKDPNVIYNIEGSDNVQADWNQTDTTADDYIKNKPTIPAAQVNSDWNAVSGVAQILNKPTIPTVPAMTTETLTFTMQGGTTKTIDFYVVPNYFYVEDVSGSNNTLTIKNDSNTNPVEVFKSTDRSNWTSMGVTNSTGITATIPANSKLYLKATTNNFGGEFNYNTIKASGNHNVGGNTMSLMYGDSFENKTVFPTGSRSNLAHLFYNNTKLINANNLELPATTLTAVCYYQMFYGCTNLVTAPQSLPATTLTTACYNGMFYNCKSLTTAPVIDATVMSGNNACQQMFYGCTALTTAPTLLIKELKTYNNLCKEMFRGCISLNNITVYFNDVSGFDCLNFWVTDVAATGDFYNLGTASLPSGQHGIPSGWTVHTSL